MKMEQLQIFAIAIGGGIALPLFLARFAAGSNWIIIAVASASWPAFLYFWLANGWGYEREAALWAMGFALWSNWLAIPVISACLSAGLRILEKHDVR